MTFLIEHPLDILAGLVILLIIFVIIAVNITGGGGKHLGKKKGKGSKGISTEIDHSVILDEFKVKAPHEQML